MKCIKGTVTLICHLSNAIMRWPNCPPPPYWGQLLGSTPRMTKESDVEAKGFCILMIYLVLLLFSRSAHRYNVSITKALLTLTIWPSDQRCSQSHSLDSGHRCRTCLSALTINFVSLRKRKAKPSADKTWSRGVQRQLTLQVQCQALFTERN